MLIWGLLILSFLASLIPSLRENFKRQSPIYCKIIGILVAFLGLLFSFYLYPKLTSIYSYYGSTYDPNKEYLLMDIFLIIIGIVIFSFGIKLKKFMMTDLGYYLIIILVYLLLGICTQILLTTTINPIYKITFIRKLTI
jgi:hypothetical protein